MSAQVYGRLTMLEELRRGRRIYWRCRCECGRETTALRFLVKGGGTKSCGCGHVPPPSRRTHGMARTPTHHTWLGMVKRCTNKNEPAYPNYGGRGITVCERWLKFENFVADMGVKPEGATIERIDNSGHYEPGNCRWATRREQMRNTRRTIFVAIGGETLCLKDWAARAGIKYQTVWAAYRRGVDLAEYLAVNGRGHG